MVVSFSLFTCVQLPLSHRITVRNKWIRLFPERYKSRAQFIMPVQWPDHGNLTWFNHLTTVKPNSAYFLIAINQLPRSTNKRPLFIELHHSFSPLIGEQFILVPCHTISSVKTSLSICRTFQFSVRSDETPPVGTSRVGLMRLRLPKLAATFGWKFFLLSFQV